MRRTAVLDGDKVIGERLKQLRKYKGMSLQNVADILGCSKCFVHQVEKGKSASSFTMIDTLAQLFDVPLSYFSTANKDDKNE